MRSAERTSQRVGVQITDDDFGNMEKNDNHVTARSILLRLIIIT